MIYDEFSLSTFELCLGMIKNLKMRRKKMKWLAQVEKD